ncbi:MAG: OmpH family outer membrane protein [Pyrinomonadaceae bacterium]
MLLKRLFILSLVVLAFTSVHISAQAQAATSSKIVIIDTSVFFNEKLGITKIVAASKTLTAELAPKRSVVEQFVARIDALNKEMAAFQANASKGIPVDEKAAQSKFDELERLKREGKFQEDEYNVYAQKRQSEIVGPVYSEVLKSLGEYVKSKDYGILFDASKDQTGILIYASDKYDITKEFIAFYNARPVTAIAPVPR